ncbi:hypothetical protein BVRB_3g058520 [Beta vulgaris subsp. vulgaris]|nr:hypothetical protein BVRB_3g058520 [Beta vulgaris subsp. vulgaris]
MHRAKYQYTRTKNEETSEVKLLQLTHFLVNQKTFEKYGHPHWSYS